MRELNSEQRAWGAEHAQLLERAFAGVLAPYVEPSKEIPHGLQNAVVFSALVAIAAKMIVSTAASDLETMLKLLDKFTDRVRSASADLFVVVDNSFPHLADTAAAAVRTGDFSKLEQLLTSENLQRAANDGFVVPPGSAAEFLASVRRLAAKLKEKNDDKKV